MMKIDLNKFRKESYKVKGNIDIDRATVLKLKEIEKKGVQVNLIIASMLEDLDLDDMLLELDNESSSSDKPNDKMSGDTHQNRE